MTPGSLVSAVSIALDVPRETVFQHDRNLVVGGLRSSSGRGRNAAVMTPLDAARLVVALLGSAKVLDSVETVQAFTAISFHTMEGDPPKDPAIAKLPRNHNFIEAVAALINDACDTLQFESPVQFLRRFSPLEITCRTLGSEFSEQPLMRRVNASVIGNGLAYYETAGFARRSLSYIAKDRRERKNRDSYKRLSKLYGIGQSRAIPGTAIMILGRAFRDDGLTFASTKEAIADLLQAGEAPKIRKRTSKKVVG